MTVDTIVTEGEFNADHWVNERVLYLNGEDAPDDAVINAQSFEKIIITFNNGHDGRGFSLSRQLRDAGFTGHIRAQGSLVPDQWRHLMKTGFDDLLLSEEQVMKMPLQSWKDAQQAILPDYQHRIFNLN